MLPTNSQAQPQQMGPPGCWRWLRGPSSPLHPPGLCSSHLCIPGRAALHSGGALPTLKGTTADDPWNKKKFCEPVAHQRGLHQLGDAWNAVLGFEQQTEQGTKHPTPSCPLLVALELLPALKPTTEVTVTGDSSDSCERPPQTPQQLEQPLMLQLPLRSTNHASERETIPSA